MKLDFTLLEIKDVFDKYEAKVAMTDFAILLGGIVSITYYSRKGIDLKDRTSKYFTKADDRSNNGYYVSDYDIRYTYAIGRTNNEQSGISYFSILNRVLSESINNLEIKEVEFGEYPQTIVGEMLSSELESLYIKGELHETGKEYTTDSRYYNEYNNPFQERKHIEYEYNGEKYIRIFGDYSSSGKILSDGRRVVMGVAYFVKVEPIVWMISADRNFVVPKKFLFSGIQFNNKVNYKRNFNSTNMYYFLKNCFSKDIIPSRMQIPKLYLVNFSANEEKYYLAYEKEGILRELYTNIELVPEDANFIKEDALMYHSLKPAEPWKYYLYINDDSDINTEEYLDYLYELCVLGGKEDMYLLYEEEIVNGSEMELLK